MVCAGHWTPLRGIRPSTEAVKLLRRGDVHAVDLAGQGEGPLHRPPLSAPA